MNPWPAQPCWDTPTGGLIKRLAALIPENRKTPILLFGSAALQFTITPKVMSRDADISPDIVPMSTDELRFPRALDRQELSELARKAGPYKGVQFEVCSPDVFRSTPRWERRSMSLTEGKLEITVPHPIDILVPKLARSEIKDRDNLLAVRQSCANWPREKELLAEMQRAFPLFEKVDRSNLQTHMQGQFQPDSQARTRLRQLWKYVYGRELNVEKEVVQIGQQILQQGWHNHPQNLKESL